MWQLYTLIFCVVVYLMVTNNNKSSDIYNVEECSINVQRNSPQDPLVLQYTPNGLQLQFPTQKTIRMKNDEEIYIGCPTGKLQTPIRTLYNGRFSCQANTMFLSPDRTKVDFNDITCRSSVEVTTVKSGEDGNTCVEKYDEAKIGYNVFKQFVPAYTVCSNEHSAVKVYSKTSLTKGGGTGIVTNTDVERIYTASEQKAILGAQVPIDSTKFWTKGQLTAESELDSRFQKEAGLHSNNVFPQWSESRAVWTSLEQSIRKNVTEEATVFTGTFGELQVNGTSVKLGVAVPKLVWKVVHVQGQAISNYVFFTGNYKDGLNGTEICKTRVTTADVFLGESWVGSKGKVGVFVCEKEFVVDEELRSVLQKL